MVILGIAVGLLLLITFARPQLFGAAWVRWTAWLRFWEHWMMHSKEGYMAVKDKKVDQLRKSSEEIIDSLANLRGRLVVQKNQHKALQAKEDRYLVTKELLLKKAEALSEGAPEFAKLADEMGLVDKDIAKIDQEQAVLEEQITELTEEIELTSPYLDEVDDQVKKTEMERDLGAMKIEVGQLKEDRARRLGRLSGAGRTYVDELERDADAYLQKTVERGKIADERSSSNAEAVTKKYEKEARAKTSAERLSAELARRRGEKATPAKPETASPEGLSK